VTAADTSANTASTNADTDADTDTTRACTDTNAIAAADAGANSAGADTHAHSIVAAHACAGAAGAHACACTTGPASTGAHTARSNAHANAISSARTCANTPRSDTSTGTRCTYADAAAANARARIRRSDRHASLAKPRLRSEMIAGAAFDIDCDAGSYAICIVGERPRRHRTKQETQRGADAFRVMHQDLLLFSE
jgi:hypothetical protein